MNEIKITLPYPVSANRYWRSFVPKGHQRAIVTLSDEAKAYKKQVQWMCKAAGIIQPITGRVHVDIQLFPKRPLDFAKRMQKFGEEWDDDVQCLDLDNVNKVLFDAIKGIAIDDDKWVRKLTAERMSPDGGDPRVVLTIKPIVIEKVQAEIF